jgi:hypothetical protein
MLLCDVCNKPLDTSAILKPCLHRAHKKCESKACETCLRIKWNNEVGIYRCYAAVGVLCMMIICMEALSFRDESRQDVNEIHAYMEKIKGLASSDIRARDSLIRFKDTARAVVFALTREEDSKPVGKIHNSKQRQELTHPTMS